MNQKEIDSTTQKDAQLQAQAVKVVMEMSAEQNRNTVITCGDKAYAVQYDMKSLQVPQAAKILQINMVSPSTEKVIASYDAKDMDNGIQIDNVICSVNALYWVVSYQDAWRLERYDLTTHSIATCDSGLQDTLKQISCGDKGIAWLKKNETCIQLEYQYNSGSTQTYAPPSYLLSEQFIVFEDEVCLAVNQRGKLAFLHVNMQTGEQAVTKTDLHFDQIIFNCNNKYTVWQDTATNTIYYMNANNPALHKFQSNVAYSSIWLSESAIILRTNAKIDAYDIDNQKWSNVFEGNHRNIHFSDKRRIRFIADSDQQATVYEIVKE